MARAPRGHIYSDRRGRWRWKLVGANGEIQCPSEGYASKRNAIKGFEAARRNFAAATLSVED
jgi:uncharacterized protein YegP (UPF0339 family)